MLILYVAASALSTYAVQETRGISRLTVNVAELSGALLRIKAGENGGEPWETVDRCVKSLVTGEADGSLSLMRGPVFEETIPRLSGDWEIFKVAALNAGSERDDEFRQRLALLAKDAETLLAETAKYSNTSARGASDYIQLINLVFIIWVLICSAYYVASLSVKQRAGDLSALAYIDSLTRIPNRADCERALNEYRENPPDKTIGVMMFDMNSLKAANDALGHSGGDRLIVEFGRILAEAAHGSGSVWRYGGDEFLALFAGDIPADADSFLRMVNEKTVSYNLLHIDARERITFAQGFSRGNPKERGIDKLIHDADRQMYERKREMKDLRD
jgi:diguanylate cyclase (GGDEF)-like protein